MSTLLLLVAHFVSLDTGRTLVLLLYSVLCSWSSSSLKEEGSFEVLRPSLVCLPDVRVRPFAEGGFFALLAVLLVAEQLGGQPE